MIPLVIKGEIQVFMTKDAQGYPVPVPRLVCPACEEMRRKRAHIQEEMRKDLKSNKIILPPGVYVE